MVALKLIIPVAVAEEAPALVVQVEVVMAELEETGFNQVLLELSYIVPVVAEDMMVDLAELVVEETLMVEQEPQTTVEVALGVKKVLELQVMVDLV